MQAGSEHPLEPGLDSLINSLHGPVEMQLRSGSALHGDRLRHLHRRARDTAELLPVPSEITFQLCQDQAAKCNTSLLYLGEFICQKI